MIKELLVTALIGLAVSLPLGLATFCFSRWGMERSRVLQIVCSALLFLLAAGMVYGVLRFNGAIRFPNDNTVSFNWFDASWRDVGFKCVYGCGTFAAGLAAALHSVKKQTKN